MSLDVIPDYISEARILLQDVAVPYRYPDVDLVTAFNIAIMGSRKLRPDLWLGVTTLPQFYGLVTSAATLTSSNTLNFASVPSAIVQGMLAYDITTPGAIASVTNPVAGITASTVALTNNVAAQVNSGDTIVVGPASFSIDPQYRMAFVYFMCGNAQMRDEESTEDNRAASFMQMWKESLVAL